MTKVLDILEQFLNIHGHRYLRLDGATKVEQRQILTDRFNNDPKIPVFILSTRSGGLGINLTGADTVIFYDLDWNPAMDKQCQDRCHRIGQTRDVHIYRFVSEYTIESNILRKSNQKRMLDDVVIQEGEFTTDYFNKLTISDMLGDEVVKDLNVEEDKPILPGASVERALEAAEDVEDAAAAKVAQKEVVDTDVADFAEKGTPATPKEVSTNQNRADSISRDATSAPETAAETPRGNLEYLDTNKGLGHDIYGEGWGRIERENEAIEEYMIRHMEWELIDVPVVLPDKSKSKKKKSKKGKPF
jgi:helicase SWR1